MPAGTPEGGRAHGRRTHAAAPRGARGCCAGPGWALGTRSASAAAPTTTYAVPGLRAPGEILVDRWGIPHIYGASEPDVFFLRGFNAARDRLWHLPVAFDPAKGWFATANALNSQGLPLPPAQARLRVGPAVRSSRIAAVLRRDRRVTLDDARRLQGDHLSLQAVRIVPLLDGVPAPDARVGRAIALLRASDRRLDPGWAAAALFEVWLALELPYAVLSAVLASEAAIDRTEALLGLDWARWRWGRLHVARLEHPISPRVGARLRRRLDVGPVPVGGGSHTVGNTSYGSGPRADGEAATRAYFEVAGGASYRQVVDVGRWDRSLVINSPGQSGDPGSPHYRDLIERWARNEPVPMLSSRRAVQRAAERRIELRPG